MIAGSGPTVAFNAWVPLDDDHTVQISFRSSLKEPVTREASTTRQRPLHAPRRLPARDERPADPLALARAPRQRLHDQLREPADGDVLRHPARGQAAGHRRDGEHGRGRPPRAASTWGAPTRMIILVRRTLVNAAKALRDENEAAPDGRRTRSSTACARPRCCCRTRSTGSRQRAAPPGRRRHAHRELRHGRSRLSRRKINEDRVTVETQRRPADGGGAGGGTAAQRGDEDDARRAGARLRRRRSSTRSGASTRSTRRGRTAGCETGRR